MNFLQQNCRFGFYTQGKAALCKSFKCGDNDLDDFFTKDAKLKHNSDILFAENRAIQKSSKEALSYGK